MNETTAMILEGVAQGAVALFKVSLVYGVYWLAKEIVRPSQIKTFQYAKVIYFSAMLGLFGADLLRESRLDPSDVNSEFEADFIVADTDRLLVYGVELFVISGVVSLLGTAAGFKRNEELAKQKRKLEEGTR